MVALSLGAMIMPSSLEIRIDNLTFLSFSNALTSWYALSKSSGCFCTLNRVSRLGVCSASSSESVSTLHRFTPPLCRGLRSLEVGAAGLAGSAGPFLTEGVLRRVQVSLSLVCMDRLCVWCFCLVLARFSRPDTFGLLLFFLSPPCNLERLQGDYHVRIHFVVIERV